MHAVVVGAGVQGIMTAYYLNQYGVEVTVVDSAESAAMKCSFANGGGITASATEPWNAPGCMKMFLKYFFKKDAPLIFRLKTLPSMLSWNLQFLKHANMEKFVETTRQNAEMAFFSLEQLKEIRAETGIEYDLQTKGTLKIFRDQVSLDENIELSHLFKLEGKGEFSILNSSQTIAAEPSLTSIKQEITGSIVFPEDESGNSHVFCQNMAKILKSRGVEFLFNTKINKIEKKAGLFELSSSSLSHNTIQKTQTIKADKVVIAAGALSPILAKSFGLNIPVKPAKGYSLSIDMNNFDNKPKHLIADMNLHAAINPLGNTLRVASTAEFTGFDDSIAQQRIDSLTRFVGQLFPDEVKNIDQNNLNAWCGFRPMSCDGQAILGKTKIEGLYLNTGHGHLGWTLSAASGRSLAETMLNKPVEFDIAKFNVSRF